MVADFFALNGKKIKQLLIVGIFVKKACQQSEMTDKTEKIAENLNSF